MDEERGRTVDEERGRTVDGERGRTVDGERGVLQGERGHQNFALKSSCRTSMASGGPSISSADIQRKRSQALLPRA